jgi:glycosyltransferase involved in cell wall biosynthesis
MKVAFLWGLWTGYADALAVYLRQHCGAEVYRSRIGEAGSQKASRLNFTDQYRFDGDQFAAVDMERVFDHDLKAEDIIADLNRFEPDCIICLPWRAAQYRKVLKEFEGRAVRIVCFDTQWSGSIKQYLAQAVSSFYFSQVDGAIITGPRQLNFAHRMGFKPTNIVVGFAACDLDYFLAADVSNVARNRSFLYVGRLAESKGVDVLISAYRQYAAAAKDPWKLIIAGEGPLRSAVEATDGIDYRGFVQPQNIRSLFEEASCFVLPSRFEPWGVVIQEATASGLGVVCTENCGSSDVYVREGQNGFVVKSGDAGALEQAMAKFARLPPDEIGRVSNLSRDLSKQITFPDFAAGVARMVEVGKSSLRWKGRSQWTGLTYKAR